MVPNLIGAMCAITWHIYDNQDVLYGLVTLQGIFTFIGKTLIHLYEISPSGEIKKVFLSENGGIQEPYLSLIIPSGSYNKV